IGASSLESAGAPVPERDVRWKISDGGPVNLRASNHARSSASTNGGSQGRRGRPGPELQGHDVSDRAVWTTAECTAFHAQDECGSAQEARTAWIREGGSVRNVPPRLPEVTGEGRANLCPGAGDGYGVD